MAFLLVPSPAGATAVSACCRLVLVCKGTRVRIHMHFVTSPFGSRRYRMAVLHTLPPSVSSSWMRYLRWQSFPWSPHICGHPFVGCLGCGHWTGSSKLRLLSLIEYARASLKPEIRLCTFCTQAMQGSLHDQLLPCNVRINDGQDCARNETRQ